MRSSCAASWSAPSGASRALGRSGDVALRPGVGAQEAQAIRPQLDELDAILAELQERAREARRSWVSYASSPSTSSISEA